MVDTRIAALEEARHRMDGEHQTFADCLLGQLEFKNGLTEREWFWVGELARRYPPPQAIQLEGSFGPMVAMMVMAETRLINPQVKLQTNDEWGNSLDVTLELNKQEGNVKVRWRSGGGKITGDGMLVSRREVPKPIVDMLNEFSKEPLQAIKAYARRTGRCCFCGAPLNDERSVKVGYGPTCAEHYGLSFPKERTVEGMLAQLEKL